MQRIIKFRAWNKQTSKIVDLYKITPLATAPEFEQDGLFIPFDEDHILMQYTGLKDKNGKEIYEGDIVIPTVMEDDNIGFWRGHSGKFTPIPQVIKWENCGFELPTWDTKMPSWKIIGNIYENPELEDTL